MKKPNKIDPTLDITRWPLVDVPAWKRALGGTIQKRRMRSTAEFETLPDFKPKEPTE